MSWKLNEITTSSTSPPPSVTASDPRAALSPPSCSSQLLNFKRGIKRDISGYPTLKDEKYYESFKRSVLVTARAHMTVKKSSNPPSGPEVMQIVGIIQVKQ